MKQLTAGFNRDQACLYDNQWMLIWDSATATTPAYRHIATWVHAVINHVDGTRWVGRFYRCPEGVRREEYPSLDYLNHLLKWPTFEEFAS